MIDIGFVSAIFPEKSFDQVIDFAAENNFKCVEIMCWPRGIADRRYAGVTHIDMETLDLRNIHHILNYCAKKKVYISALGYYPNLMDADLEKRKQYFQHLVQVIKAANVLNIPVVNTFVGRNKNLNTEENILLFKEIWPPIMRYAQQYNVNIGIENCPMYFTNDEWPNGTNLAISPAIWDQLFEIDKFNYFGLNYDPSHMIWQQMDYILPITEYSHKFHHVHLKDAKLNRDKLDRVGILATPLEYHDPKLPGRGDINWPLFLKAIAQSQYKGPLVIEFEDKEYETKPELIKKGLLETRDFIKGILKTLKVK